MIIPTHLSVRGIFATSLILAAFSIYILFVNSKDKEDYDTVIGKVTLIDSKYQDYPKRHKGDFRYLVLNSYPFPFEVYLPNAAESRLTMDDLSEGDVVSVFYYENNSTFDYGINKFAQFIDRGDQEVFIRGTFQQQLGYIVLGLSLSLNLMSFLLWKTGNLMW